MSLLDYSSYFDSAQNNGSTSGFLHAFSFLNTSRSGSAQSSAGISFQTFISSVMISVILCLFQTSIFSLLRCKLKNIYQPNCYYVPEDEKIPPLKDGFFSWIPKTFLSPLNNYMSLGLDAYFFLRYLSFLLVLFFGLACVNIPVLIPVNYTSGYDNYSPLDLVKYTNGTVPKLAIGLDRISMSNIAPLFSKRLSIHLTMAIISIGWFHGIVFTELLNYAKIKNQYLASQDTERPHGIAARNHRNTILVDNVPANLLDRRAITRVFSKISGNKIKNIWFVYNYMDLKKHYENNIKYIDDIEALETKIMFSKFFTSTENNFVTDGMRFGHNKRLYFIRRISDIRIGLMYYVIPRFYLKDTKLDLEVITEKYLANRYDMQEERAQLIARENSPLNDRKFNKVFIQFEDSFHPHLFNQIQISDKLNELDNTIILIDPKDIIWENLSIQSNAQVFIRVVIGNALSIILILGWVVPVAFIGLVSQLPYLTVLIPFLSWLNYLPDYITDVISNMFSVALLMCLSETVPYTFRTLSFIKCKKTGAQVEYDVQKWMFVFLFIHIFMVVTISSGITVIIESLINNPVSIPNLLARNLPKCSNFFFSYLVIRGLSYFGNNLLQNLQLIKTFLINPLKDYTPRRKFNRLASIPSYKWGSVYPTFAVLGSIGLIYCILSPLILVFCIFAIFMVLVSFKYSLRYQFNMRNPSENYGQFYPRAIFQLYFGIYFMEICLIGLFVLSRDENGDANCLTHALITFAFFILTATCHYQFKKMLSRILSKNLPLTLYEPQNSNDNDGEDEEAIEETVEEAVEEAVDEVERGNVSVLNRARAQLNLNPIVPDSAPNRNLYNDTFHHACFQHNNSIIWIPKDNLELSENELRFLKTMNIECTNENAELTNNGDVVIQNCPPDFIE